MAKQVGPLFVTGTIDGIIFYKLGDQYYMRSKGDYKSGKQMRKDPRLKRTMQKADQFRAAVKLLKPLYYRHLPKAVRKYGLFGKLTGLVNTWMQAGKTQEEAKELLLAHLHTLAAPSAATAASATGKAEETTPVVNATTTGAQSMTTLASMIREGQTLEAKPPVQVKQARYLSSWKVKQNGRLHVPKYTTQRRQEDAVAKPAVVELPT